MGGCTTRTWVGRGQGVARCGAESELPCRDRVAQYERLEDEGVVGRQVEREAFHPPEEIRRRLKLRPPVPGRGPVI